MRAEGALRLILNAALFPHTVAKRVQEKGVQVRVLWTHRAFSLSLVLSFSQALTSWCRACWPGVGGGGG
jgi:hypothetical protein